MQTLSLVEGFGALITVIVHLKIVQLDVTGVSTLSKGLLEYFFDCLLIATIRRTRLRAEVHS
ncbi:hypothetical protein AOQ72_16160 [Bradyrhizobium yuanmingense]|uniref:Uncharacterized protein n=1 Tax=Bradyrhizobium yuanmingense TaxID=108015 RepID=A0A0R3CM88_9BRAD|nr:hypothetical protein AOQ72_16160 [Bradyrhizobium yuanmingense]